MCMKQTTVQEFRDKIVLQVYVQQLAHWRISGEISAIATEANTALCMRVSWDTYVLYCSSRERDVSTLPPALFGLRPSRRSTAVLQLDSIQERVQQYRFSSTCTQSTQSHDTAAAAFGTNWSITYVQTE